MGHRNTPPDVSQDQQRRLEYRKKEHLEQIADILKIDDNLAVYTDATVYIDGATVC